MLKYLSDDCNHILYYLICKIIELGYLPKQWKEATVFPIAKLKPFNCELSNSRPITLLETTRKALISLLNHRLATILKDNNVLKANQFAGLPKQSTFEPIRIMNEVIQDSIDNNNELWILSQDMGKAYDRVNIFQLKKVMDRIKIPNDFSSLILELFKDRKNQVITAYGKTAPYDVLTGIDQGECIYYDPLLAEIDKQQLGYNISCISKSVVQEEGVINQQNVSIMAYMDDTQWITDEKSKLEKMLYIADTFYRLNDIQINKEKSELMMRTTTEKRKYSHNYNDKISIKFGREEINIKAKHPHEPMRILGVYFNIEHDGNYLMFKIKNEIDHLVNLMYKKKITDKHILYIFNRIIISRVEYWSQVMALSKTQTEALIIPFRRMFKNKLKFARSAPNAILDNPYIYGYRDFYDNQLQAKITDFCIQLNDNGLLGKVTEIRLKSLQDQLWTSRPLIEKLPYNRVPHTRKNNYILNMLLLCYDNNISLENLDNNTFPSIKGGKIPLEDVVDNAYYSKHRERLREKNILFLDQIISGDKSRLLLWKEILIKAYIPISSQRKEAKWYTDIRNFITTDSIHLRHSISHLFDARVDNVEEARSYDISKKNRSLIAFYNSQYNSVVIGKIQEIDETQRPVIKHFNIDMSQCTDTHTYTGRNQKNWTYGKSAKIRPKSTDITNQHI
ncbi:hypothetical protein RirG_211360 [Rhizophagus irregularis DAOM 197198w]|uniref:Reverse transcriptase domain-containing protein n=1 Tax=Rhizophagus irregularis (strain DAOM 197198w) TaxID=1432141 RepID=A0A015KBW3_RHIIW|nr:hypothetical protein RirG_211360 [Rhizophagus irregularis DAOM 197198w]